MTPADEDIFDGDRPSVDRLDDSVAWFAGQIVAQVLLGAGHPSRPSGYASRPSGYASSPVEARSKTDVALPG